MKVPLRSPPAPSVAAAVAVLLSVALAATPVAETEPNAWTGSPQDLGALPADGFEIAGTVDPADPADAPPGDADGYRFTFAAGGSLSVAFDASPGTAAVLVLGSEDAEGDVTALVARSGRAPFTLAAPDLAAGGTYRVGVTAFGDGSPLPYTLTVLAEEALPAWSGDPCVPVAETEGDAGIVGATDLGDFTGPLCGSGSLLVASPPGSGADPDVDGFLFRNVLPVPARLRLSADPGLVRVSVEGVVFVGSLPFHTFSFGAEGETTLPTLVPGAQYLLRIWAEQGEAPLAYSFDLEPVAPPGPPEASPLEIVKGVLRRPGDEKRSSFDIRGTFDPTAPEAPDASASGIATVRSLERGLVAGTFTEDEFGRLTWKALPKGPGLRRVVLDPVAGTLRMKGKGGDLDGELEALDPEVAVSLLLGEFHVSFFGDARIVKSGLRLP